MPEIRNQAGTIAEAVFLHAGSRPEAYALVDRNGPVCYRQLWDRICACAAVLQELGAGNGSRVVMECTQDVTFVAVNLACQLAGAIFVGVERKVAVGRLEEILRQTEPVLLLTNRAVALSIAVKTHLVEKEFNAIVNDKLAEAAQQGAAEETGKVPIPYGGQSAETAKEPGAYREQSAEAAKEPALCGERLEGTADDWDAVVRRLDSEAIAEIMFSTGTTGKTKGAVMTGRANVANAQNIIDGVRMEADAVEMIPLPVNHAHGIRTVYAHLLNGSCALIANGITFPRVLLDMMQKYGANAIDLSPSAAQMLINTSARKLKEIAPGIRYVEVGTAFLPEATKSMLRACFPNSRLYNFYGSSESGRTCCLEFSSGMEKPGCIGRPVPNARFAVLDESGHPMQSDAAHTGRLASAGPMNMSGYWKEPELSAETLQNGYVLTADVAYIDEDRCIYVLGRQDDVIVYKGIKISPEEIEEAAKGCDLIADCACIPEADELAGQVPRLFVVPRDREAYREDEVFAYLKKHIDDNRMPRTIEVIDAIPRTYNGKILRRELRSNGAIHMS